MRLEKCISLKHIFEDESQMAMSESVLAAGASLIEKSVIFLFRDVPEQIEALDALAVGMRTNYDRTNALSFLTL